VVVTTTDPVPALNAHITNIATLIAEVEQARSAQAFLESQVANIKTLIASNDDLKAENKELRRQIAVLQKNLEPPFVMGTR
jgi:cell division protein FtsB